MKVMKTKALVLLFVVAIATVNLARIVKTDSTQVMLMLQNIEALANNEDHGGTDTTLEPYYKESTKQIWIPGMNGTTTVPCCESVSSKYSGCAKGLDRC